MTLANRATARRLKETAGSRNTDLNVQAILPPASLWDGNEGSEAVFFNTVSNAPDYHLSILEMEGVQGEVSEAAPLTMKLPETLMQEEALIPFAYDKASGLYFPVGYTNSDNTVLVEALPEPTNGILSEAGDGDPDARSVGGSIKLFFHKMVWSKLTGKHDYRTLSLVKRGLDGSVERIPYNKAQEENLQHLQTAVKDKKTLLVIHGIIGDTEDMVLPFLDRTEVQQRYGAVLCFDYENLNTPIKETAQKLLTMLQEVGVSEKSLTIVAHSMGGLVSRAMIELMEGDKLVEKLVMFGTPNAGSDVAEFRKRLARWATFAMNGVARFKPYLKLFAFLGKHTTKALFKTLDEMHPNSSFLSELNASGGSKGIPYSAIAGDTTHIEASFDEDDSLFKKIWISLKDRGAYIALDLAVFQNEPNDMAVKVESIHTVKGADLHTVTCDHVSYFEEGASLEKMSLVF